MKGVRKMSITIEEYAWIFPHKKIKIPFQERRDKVRWPDNKIIAVHIYIAQEWWGRDFWPGPDKVLDIGNLSQEENYNFDVGIWRALDLLDRYELKATFFLSGAGAKYQPEVIREVKQRGHEVAGHSYYQSRNAARMDPEEEKEDIVKTTAILESVSGERPRGWINPAAGCSERTFEFLVEQGYVWNADLRDDDLPYGIKVKDKILIEIPHRTMTTNDFAWFSGRLGIDSPIKAQRGPREAVEFFRDTFDCYYETAKREGAQSLTFGIHPFISCWPDRIVAIERMIAYMKGFPDVWLTTYGNLARWWKENYL
jgi:peptidoglycan/xylan/chitin deacetylase (PgdA/CDA1 family)